MIKVKSVLPLSISFSLISLFSFSTSLQAQDIENNGNIYLGGVKYFFDEDHHQKNKLGFLLGGEVPTSERWSYAMEYWNIDSDYRGFSGSSDVSYTRLGFNYHLNRINKWQPYLSVGIGSMDIDSRAVANNSTDGLAFDFGAGLKRRIRDNFLVRGDARAIKVARSHNLDYALSLSVAYVFGKKSKVSSNSGTRNLTNSVALESPVMDFDNDGINDDLDNCPSTSSKLAVDEKGCPILDVSLMRQTLAINFAFDQSLIAPGYDSDIRGFAEFMQEYTNTSVVIEGHTDSDGSEEYNQALSERRARAVMSELIETYSIEASRLSAVGYGESRPATNNTSVSGKAGNRRIVADVSVEIEKERLR